jgi:protoporphyrinogen oxidase
MILIIGGGLAGLAAAHYLERSRSPYVLLEKEAEVGGLCRSIRSGGYTFDFSGHLLCCQDDDTLALVRQALDGRLASFDRKAFIFVGGRRVPHPFQAHLGFLPEGLTRECLVDFLLQATKGEAPLRRDYVSWVLGVFGQGMGRHFFFPYSRKLWGIPPEELSVEGVEWSIPRPSLAEVVNGALGEAQPRLGYNPTFLYPSEGGIEVLPRALAGGLSSIRTGCGVREILWQKGLAITDGGERIPYDRIISSVPLPHMIRMLHPLAPSLEEMAQSLRWVSVWALNVGVKRPQVSDQHWIYFPEPRYPFFRVGCYTAFGPHLAPAGCSSLYVEVSGHAVDALGSDWVKACLEGLVACGLLRGLDEVDVIQPILLPVAYVVHDEARLRALPLALAFLEGEGIHCAGRYGNWGYGTMAQALAQGKEAAVRAVG